jgi:hypothetical protein
MRKIQKAALVAAMLGSIGFVGAGTAAAHGGDFDITQANACRTHDLNVAALNNIGVLNGLGGNILGGEGNPGAQLFDQGSKLSCSNSAG